MIINSPQRHREHREMLNNRCVYIRTMDLICTRLSGMEAGIQVPRMAPPMAIHIRVNWIPVSLPGRRCRSTTAITYVTINNTDNLSGNKERYSLSFYPKKPLCTQCLCGETNNQNKPSCPRYLINRKLSLRTRSCAGSEKKTRYSS